MVREKCGSMFCRHVASCNISTLCLSIHESIASPSELLLQLHTQHLLLLQLIVRFCKNAFCVFPHRILWHANFVWILRWQCTCCCRRISKCFPDWRILSKGVFSCAHQTVHETGCLRSVCVQSEREAVPDINVWENILEMVQKSPKLSTHRIASCISVLHMQVWQSLHEEDLPQSEGSTSWTRRPYSMYGFVQIVKGSSSTVKRLILFTSKASFIQDGISSSQNLHTWSYGNPCQKRVTNFQRRFSVWFAW
jgi:hypothetical protein